MVVIRFEVGMSNQSVLRSLGTGLRHVRKSKGLTLGHVADKVGVHLSTLSRVELGETDLPLMTWRRLLTVLGLDEATVARDGIPVPPRATQGSSKLPKRLLGRR